MKFLSGASLCVTVVVGLVGCGQSSVEAEYCALRAEVTKLTAEALAGRVSGNISSSRADELMRQANEKLPRLETLTTSLPSDFNYDARCK